MELATTTEHSQAGTTKSLPAGLVQQHIFFLANRHRALKESQLCNRKHVCSLETGPWARPEGAGLCWSVAPKFTHRPVLLLALTDVLHHNLNPSNSNTHTLKPVLVTEWSKARSLLGHKSTCPSANGITLGGKRELRMEALCHRPSSATSKSSKNMTVAG